MITRPIDQLAVLHVLDVGHGDSIVLELPTREVIVVDAALSTKARKQTPKTILCLEEIARRTGRYDIDLLCLTHPDRDHYGGMSQVIDWARSHGGNIRRLVLFPGPAFNELRERVRRKKEVLLQDNGPLEKYTALRFRQASREFGKLTDRFIRLKRSIVSKGMQYNRASDFCHICTIGSADIYGLGPTSSTLDDHADQVWDSMMGAWLEDKDSLHRSDNQISRMLLVVIGQAKIMLTGDATASAWLEALRVYDEHYRSCACPDILSCIVKAPHHGSQYGSSIEAWKRSLATDASIVAISCGLKEHPDKQTIADIGAASQNASVFCTNSCQARRTALGELSGIPVGAVGAWQTDSDPPAEIADFLDPLTCHGDIRFTIDPNGVVTADPQFQHGACNLLASGQGDNCYEDHCSV